MCGELGMEEGETIFKGGNAPPEAVSGRATYTTAAAILYAGLIWGSSERKDVYRDESVLTMLLLYIRLRSHGHRRIRSRSQQKKGPCGSVQIRH